MPVVLLLVLSSSGVSAELHGDTGKTPPVTIYARFAGTHSPQLFTAVQSELGLIMAPVGVGFEWRDLNGVRGNEVCVEIVVVSFMGQCDARSPVEPAKASRSLGWTHVSDGEILPFSDVDCDRVRRLIHPLLVKVPQEEQQEVLGRALGRVLAHELYHIFADTTKHSARGIAKSFYTARELVSKSFRLETEQAKAVRQGKLRHLFLHPQVAATSAAGGN